MRGLNNRDAVVQCFIKRETSVKATDPRNISPRLDEFLVTLGPYISAIEHAAFECGYLVKGLNIHERDRKLRPLCDYNNFIETDYSRFDSTIPFEYTRSVEAAFVHYCFPKEDHHNLALAMQFCEVTRGSTPLGIGYETTGRCSGDAHTSIGNGIINAFNTWLVLRNLPETSWVSFHEGDDGIIACTDEVRLQLIANIMLFAPLGFSIKIINPPSLEQTTFCGRTMVQNPTLTSMCDVKRTLSKFHITCSTLPAERAILAKSYSYWATDAQTPIISWLCYAILTILKPSNKDTRAILRSGSLSKYEKNKMLRVVDKDLDEPVVSSEMRCALELKEGIIISLQLALEDMFKSWIAKGFVPSDYGYIVMDDFSVDDERVSYHGHSYPGFR